MKCLLKYPWVKLPRNKVPGGKGLMGAWMRLAARAAFRKGEGHYCGYDNPVVPGMWVGGIVGLKAILGLRRRDAALDVLRDWKAWASFPGRWTLHQKAELHPVRLARAFLRRRMPGRSCLYH